MEDFNEILENIKKPKLSGESNIYQDLVLIADALEERISSNLVKIVVKRVTNKTYQIRAVCNSMGFSENLFRVTNAKEGYPVTFNSAQYVHSSNEKSIVCEDKTELAKCALVIADEVEEWLKTLDKSGKKYA